MEDFNTAEREVFVVGSLFGAVAGWGVHAAWVGDGPAVGLAMLIVLGFLIYRHIRIERSIGE